MNTAKVIQLFLLNPLFSEFNALFTKLRCNLVLFGSTSQKNDTNNLNNEHTKKDFEENVVILHPKRNKEIL